MQLIDILAEELLGTRVRVVDDLENKLVDLRGGRLAVVLSARHIPA